MRSSWWKNGCNASASACVHAKCGRHMVGKVSALAGLCCMCADVARWHTQLRMLQKRISSTTSTLQMVAESIFCLSNPRIGGGFMAL
eukprot:COSAG01_NODE_472_length_16538_cov_126.145690_9_plen_87_part_00